MRSRKPTHLTPLNDEEKAALNLIRDPITGLPRSRVWWGGVRFQRNKKYGGGSKHKGRDLKGRMIPDRGS